MHATADCWIYQANKPKGWTLILVVLLVLAAAIGITLGLLGAGGAIVAVPTFVYVGGIQPTLASGYALFVVMIASFVGVLPAYRARQIHWPAFSAFGVTTLLTVFSIRRWILPALPRAITVGESSLATGDVLMLAFGLVLLIAGISMLRHSPSQHSQAPSHPLMLAATGLGVGIIAGFLGVGGGFLMTPALVVWGRLDMKIAVGTSLALICVNSAAGVLGDLIGGAQFNWPLVLSFTLLTTIGIVVGGWLRNRIHADKLRAIFGYVVVAIGLAVLTLEITREFAT